MTRRAAALPSPPVSKVVQERHGHSSMSMALGHDSHRIMSMQQAAAALPDEILGT